MLLSSIKYRVRHLFRDVSEWCAHENPVEKSKKLSITWIGHSTFLIQVDNTNILLDPIFGNASLLFKRILPPGILRNNLPHIDYVLISHNHRDHMEKSTLNYLKKRNNPMIFIPSGLGKWFRNRGFKRFNEFMWWEQKEYKIDNSDVSIKCTFLPAFHWSQRAMFDKNTSLWGSWIIECNGYTIFFAGDTTYSEHIKYIAKEFSHIDIALLPIGPCEPNSLLKDAHMDADDAIKAFCDLGAQHFIPMHWGTFHFGAEPFDLSIKRLNILWSENNKLSKKQLHVFKVGQRINF